MRGGDRGAGAPRPSSWNSATARVRLHALGLVDRRGTAGVCSLAQALRDVAVAGQQAGAAVDDEQHRVGLDDRLLRLARHLGEDAALGARGSRPPVSMAMKARAPSRPSP